MTALLKLAAVSIAATVVIGIMLSVALGIFRKRIPEAAWADDPRTREQRYREAQGHD